MTAASVSGRDAELDAARLLLSRLGVSPEELLQSPAERPEVPTFREYLPVVRAAVGAGHCGRTAVIGTASKTSEVSGEWTT